MPLLRTARRRVASYNAYAAHIVFISRFSPRPNNRAIAKLAEDGDDITRPGPHPSLDPRSHCSFRMRETMPPQPAQSNTPTRYKRERPHPHSRP